MEEASSGPGPNLCWRPRGQRGSSFISTSVTSLLFRPDSHHVTRLSRPPDFTAQLGSGVREEPVLRGDVSACVVVFPQE